MPGTIRYHSLKTSVLCGIWLKHLSALMASLVSPFLDFAFGASGRSFRNVVNGIDQRKLIVLHHRTCCPGTGRIGLFLCCGIAYIAVPLMPAATIARKSHGCLCCKQKISWL